MEQRHCSAENQQKLHTLILVLHEACFSSETLKLCLELVSAIIDCGQCDIPTHLRGDAEFVR